MEQQERLERFIKDYADRAYSFAYRLTGNTDDAQELVQEAFLRAIERWDQYDQGQSGEGWFLTIVKHLYLDGSKRAYKRLTTSLDAPLDLGEDGTTFADAMPDSREGEALALLERGEASEQVQRALEALTPDHRAILTLSDLDGRSYNELCEILDAPLNTVRSRLNRARAAFKKNLLERTEETIR